MGYIESVLLEINTAITVAEKEGMTKTVLKLKELRKAVKKISEEEVEQILCSKHVPEE